MSHNEETLFLLGELEKFGMSRYDVERELSYSPNYLGQLLSRESNEKVVTALKLLLRIKLLEKELGHGPEVPQFKAAKEKEDDFKEIVSLLKDIHSSLNARHHTEELNHSLLKTSLIQSAKLEAIVTKRPYKSAVEDLNKVVSKSFQETHCIPSQNKAHSVEA